ncbi:MAG TPA: hypothetical protein VGF45_23890, partial [Polyangia bacterium]
MQHPLTTLFCGSALFVAFAASAQAQPPEETPAATTPTPTPTDPIDAETKAESKAERQETANTSGKKKKPKVADGSLEWKARIFARAAQEKVTTSSAGMEASAEARRLTIPSARFGLKYQFTDWLGLALEADITSRTTIRD